MGPWQPDTDPSPGDSSAHGVCTQGIISAITNNGTGVAGIAPGCNLIPYKIFDNGEYGNWNILIPEKAISDAIHVARQRKCSMVISCSWGYDPWYITYIDNIAKVLDTAAMEGIPVVFASGNDNFGPDCMPAGSSVSFPANLPTVIAVGAIRKTGEKWQYSGCGPELDVVAPSGATGSYDAGDLYSLDQMGEYGYNPWRVSCALTSENYNCTFGGTSGAAPQVAGILALMRSRRPDLTGFDIFKMVIDSSAVDGIGNSYDLPGWDPHYGNGLVSAFRALLAVSRVDANNDGIVNILDVNYIMSYLYYQGPAPEPDILMADANCSGTVNMSDITYIIAYRYKGGAAPPICFNYGN